MGLDDDSLYQISRRQFIAFWVEWLDRPSKTLKLNAAPLERRRPDVHVPLPCTSSAQWKLGTVAGASSTRTKRNATRVSSSLNSGEFSYVGPPHPRGARFTARRRGRGERSWRLELREHSGS